MPTLSATTYGALKAYVEGLTLIGDHSLAVPLAVYKDAPPPDVTDPTTGLLKVPYCTFIEGISVTPTSREDGGAAQGGATYVTELAQLDLWMNWRDPKTSKALENRSLTAALYRKLDGCMLELSPSRVYHVGVQNAPRLVERDNNMVHVPFTLAIRRAL